MEQDSVALIKRRTGDFFRASARYSHLLLNSHLQLLFPVHTLISIVDKIALRFFANEIIFYLQVDLHEKFLLSKNYYPEKIKNCGAYIF